VWGVFFRFTGLGKVCCYNMVLRNHALRQVLWFSAVPQDLIIFIGVREFLGDIGLIVPAMIGVKPKLTPFAALGLLLVMMLAAVFHILAGEYNFVPTNPLLGGRRRIHRVWAVLTCIWRLST
jgi:DoxX-like family